MYMYSEYAAVICFSCCLCVCVYKCDLYWGQLNRNRNFSVKNLI